MSPGGDPVAQAIAQAVQRWALTQLPADLAMLPGEAVEVAVHPVGEADTGIVVTATGQGNRYFLVQVREFTTR